MVLSAILRLDAGAFTTPLGKAVEGVKAMLRISADLGNSLGSAFDMGGMLSDLSAQTGDAVGELAVLRQAFQDTGVGADQAGRTIAMMRRAIGGTSESGEPTAAIFDQLGLNVQELQRLGATDQLNAIGAAINSLESPAQQSAAAMAIFGRSGAQMLAFLKDGGAIDAAAKSLGELPALLDRNAWAFDGISDRMGRIREKGAGLWAGIAEGLLPVADQVTETLDGIDLTSIGQRLGRMVGTAVQLFKDAPLGQTLRDGIVVGLGEAVNWTATGFAKIGTHLWRALSTPLSYFSAAIGKAIQEAMEKIGKIPKIGKMAGLDGFKAQSFGEIRADTKDDLEKLVDPARLMGKAELIDTSAEWARLKESWSDAAKANEELIANTQRIATQAAASQPGGGTLQAAAGAQHGGRSGGGEALADALGRIGGYLGGGGNSAQNKIAMWSERTARGIERLNERIGNRTATAWGV